MSILNVEVIVRSENIGGNDRRVLEAMLTGIAPIEDVDHALGIRIAKVGVMRRPIVDHCLVDWVAGLVWENASRQTGNHLFDSGLMRDG